MLGNESAEDRERGRFEGEVTAELRNLTRRIDEFLPMLRGHEQRLQAMEQTAAQGRVLGRILTIFTGILAGGLSAWVTKMLTK